MIKKFKHNLLYLGPQIRIFNYWLRVRKIKSTFLSILFSFLFDQDFRFVANMSPIDRARVAALRLLGARIGDNTFIRSNFFITSPNLLTIGSSSRLARNSSLYLYDRLEIGDYVHAGSGLTIHTSDHIIHSNYNLPIVSRGSVPSPVLISDNVYIGSNVTILSGVTIDSNVVIAAGSVVTSSLSSGYVYGGIPAKPLRSLSYE